MLSAYNVPFGHDEAESSLVSLMDCRKMAFSFVPTFALPIYAINRIEDFKMDSISSQLASQLLFAFETCNALRPLKLA